LILSLFLDGLDEDDLDNLRENFFKVPQNVLAQNVCTRCDPLEACISAQRLLLASHCFTHKVGTPFNFDSALLYCNT